MYQTGTCCICPCTIKVSFLKIRMRNKLNIFAKNFLDLYFIPELLE